MTPVEIAYFKHFLYDRGIQAVYISMYRKNRIKGGPEGDKNGNPESLELFLQQQPYFRVLTHAFYFVQNSDYGFDFWNDLSKKWRKYLEMNEDNPQNTKAVIFKGAFGILRQNWDSPRYWEKESMADTYKRMNMEPPLKDVDLETAFIVPRDINGERKVEIASESDEKMEDTSLEENRHSEPGSLLEGFSLVETHNIQGGRKMGANTVSVNSRNGGYRVTFASKQSDSLRKHGYKYVKLLTKKETGEIALIFNNLSGCGVTIKKSTSDSRNVTINSKEIVEHIREFYAVKSSLDYFTLEITATINQDLNTIYKLKLP